MPDLEKATVRKSLPLTERDLRDLETLRSSEAHRAALATLVSSDILKTRSEAALLRAVLEAGLRAVEHQVEADGYAQMAADLDAAAMKRSARRRRPSWADE